MKINFKYKAQQVVLIVILSNMISIAQDSSTLKLYVKPYKTSIGIRYGIEKGISVKHFVSSNTAFEAIISRDGYYQATRITALYEIEKSFGKCEQLFWFYGVGSHVSFYTSKLNQNNSHVGYYDYRGKWHDTDNRLNYTSGGFDGIIGIEYLMKHIPLNIRVDSKPNINILDQSINYLNVAATISCYFNWNQKKKNSM